MVAWGKPPQDERTVYVFDDEGEHVESIPVTNSNQAIREEYAKSREEVTELRSRLRDYSDQNVHYKELLKGAEDENARLRQQNADLLDALLTTIRFKVVA